jgi:hypothetical protein
MKVLKTISLFILIFCSSCTIEQVYHFNKDFSGSTRLSIDMKSFMQMMAGMDSTGKPSLNMKDSLNFLFSENAKALEEIGIKNIKLGWQDSSDVFFMSYDFDNIETLNKAMNSVNSQNATFSNTIGTEAHTYFSTKGKKLIYKGQKSEKGSSKEMESMSEYYHYALIFTFDRKIKKVDNPNVMLFPDCKRAELKGSMLEILKADFNSDITFKLK